MKFPLRALFCLNLILPTYASAQGLQVREPNWSVNLAPPVAEGNYVVTTYQVTQSDYRSVLVRSMPQDNSWTLIQVLDAETGEILLKQLVNVAPGSVGPAPLTVIEEVVTTRQGAFVALLDIVATPTTHSLVALNLRTGRTQWITTKQQLNISSAGDSGWTSTFPPHLFYAQPIRPGEFEVGAVDFDALETIGKTTVIADNVELLANSQFPSENGNEAYNSAVIVTHRDQGNFDMRSDIHLWDLRTNQFATAIADKILQLNRTNYSAEIDNENGSKSVIDMRWLGIGELNPLEITLLGSEKLVTASNSREQFILQLEEANRGTNLILRSPYDRLPLGSYRFNGKVEVKELAISVIGKPEDKMVVTGIFSVGTAPNQRLFAQTIDLSLHKPLGQWVTVSSDAKIVDSANYGTNHLAVVSGSFGTVMFHDDATVDLRGRTFGKFVQSSTHSGELRLTGVLLEPISNQLEVWAFDGRFFSPLARLNADLGTSSRSIFNLIRFSSSNPGYATLQTLQPDSNGIRQLVNVQLFSIGADQ